MSVSLQRYMNMGLNICMCYTVKVMMLRFVVLLTFTVALAECRVSVLTTHKLYHCNKNITNSIKLITMCLFIQNLTGATYVLISVERCL